jgi:hypothetical protein
MKKQISCCSESPPAYKVGPAEGETIEVTPSSYPKVEEGQDRITAVLNVYHEHVGCQPHSDEASFSKKLKTVEQPYARNLSVSDKPLALDTGWLDDPGYVLVRNVTKLGLSVIPSEEQQKEFDEKVVVVRNSDSEAGWSVQPGGFFMGEMEKESTVTLRCLSGTADVSLTIFPR